MIRPAQMDVDGRLLTPRPLGRDTASSQASFVPAPPKRTAPRSQDQRQASMPTTSTPVPQPNVYIAPKVAPIAPAVAPAPAVQPAVQPQVQPQVAPGNTLITPQNTLRNQRVGFDVAPRQVAAPPVNAEPERLNFAIDPGNSVQQAIATFNAQLPLLDRQFGDQVEGLAKNTAAMGRTGSGMFDKDFGELSDMGRATRESLLGNLINSATQSDLARSLSAQTSTQNLLAGQQGRFLDVAQNNAGREFSADQINANNDLSTQLARLNQTNQQQAREDRLADSAMGNEADRLRFLSMAFNNDPVAAQQAAAALGVRGSATYGDNASLLNAQLGETASGVVDPFLELLKSAGRGVSRPVATTTGDRISGGLV